MIVVVIGDSHCSVEEAKPEVKVEEAKSLLEALKASVEKAEIKKKVKEK